jgi:hypothetical protein
MYQEDYASPMKILTTRGSSYFVSVPSQWVGIYGTRLGDTRNTIPDAMKELR